ncbi:MAG: hypothetical protein GX842_01120 [Spirochaetales bacterium]|nr:hypothetical protein [Spirochaetales bacterium]
MKRLSGVLIVFLLLLLVSCTSVTSWVRSSFEGVPSWVYEPQSSRNQLAFVGEGAATSLVRSEILAYESVLKQISAYIGDDVFDRYMVELSTEKTISDYQLKITQEFVKQEGETILVFYLAVADKGRLATARSEAQVRVQEREQEITNLLNKATQAFRDNKDLVALNYYIEIAEIAHSMPAESGLARYNQAIKRVEDIVKALSLSVATGDPTIPTTTITLRRGKRAISPRVAEAPIIVYSPARDGLGVIYQDFQRFVTNQNGQFIYTTNNPTIVTRGDLEIAIDLEESLKTLEEIDYPTYVALIENLKEKEITYSYNRLPVTQKEEILIALSEFSLKGELLSSNYAAGEIIRELARDGIGGRIVHVGPIDEEENYIDALRVLYPDKSYAIIGEVGISDTKVLKSRVTVTVSGELSLVNLKTKRLLGSTGSVKANAVEATLEEAISEAFSKVGTVGGFLLYRYLYN